MPEIGPPKEGEPKYDPPMHAVFVPGLFELEHTDAAPAQQLARGPLAGYQLSSKLIGWRYDYNFVFLSELSTAERKALTPDLAEVWDELEASKDVSARPGKFPHLVKLLDVAELLCVSGSPGRHNMLRGVGPQAGARDLISKLPKSSLRHLRLAHLTREPGMRYEIELKRDGEQLIDLSIPFALIEEHLFEDGEPVRSLRGLSVVANGADLAGERELDFFADRILRTLIEGVDARQVGLGVLLNETRSPTTWEQHLAALSGHAVASEGDVRELLEAVDSASDTPDTRTLSCGGTTLTRLRRAGWLLKASPRRKSDVGRMTGTQLPQQGQLELAPESVWRMTAADSESSKAQRKALSDRRSEVVLEKRADLSRRRAAERRVQFLLGLILVALLVMVWLMNR